MGVPSIRSAPRTMSTGPTSGRCSMVSSITLESPNGFGRKGDRVANTPTRVLPPRRGGRTVGDQLSRTAPENCHTSQMWLKSSNPRRASGLRYSGVKMISPRSSSTSPLWRGMPNLVGKAVWIWAMTFRVMASGACCMMNSLLNRSFQWDSRRGCRTGCGRPAIPAGCGSAAPQ